MDLGRRLIRVVILLLISCVVAYGFLFYLICTTQPTESDLAYESDIDIVYDAYASASEPPSYYQADERWGGLPYGEGTLSDTGCGLTCAAMFASYIEDDPSITPTTILNLVGNRCLVTGVNDMGLFCQELDSLYGIEYSEQLWLFENAEKYLEDGWCLFAGMSGPIYEGGRSYTSHVIFIWKIDSEGVWIKDPDDLNLKSAISLEDFESLDITYFYAVRDSAD